jgi:hypothetical protein
MLRTIEKEIIAIVVFLLLAIGLTIYGQSLLKPKNNQGLMINPTSSQKTTGWVLSTVPWVIPLGIALYYETRNPYKS